MLLFCINVLEFFSISLLLSINVLEFFLSHFFLKLPELQEKMKSANQTILTPLISLDTPGKATVEVVILADPVRIWANQAPMVVKHDLKLTLSYSYSKFWYVLCFNRKVLVFTLILINFRLRKEERYKVGALS